MEWFYSYVTGGTVLVQRKGDTYTIDMDIVMEDGEPFRGHFKGDIIFEKYEPENTQGAYQPLQEDQRGVFHFSPREDITATGSVRMPMICCCNSIMETSMARYWPMAIICNCQAVICINC